MNSGRIKVLMMGARRSGKTSLLAGLIDQFSHPDIASILKVDETADTDNANKPNLKQKIRDIQDFMSEQSGKVILNNEYGTDKFSDYTVKVSVLNDPGKMEITFTDANGEFYACGDIHVAEMKKKITEYDIILVTIDTPYLMESAKCGNRLCSTVINKAYNQVDTAHVLLSNLSDDDGLNARLIVFVPMKCEKWAKEGKIDDVTKRVEEVYCVSIRALQAFKNIEILVLPVETMGNVVFHSHTRPLTLHRTDGSNLRCSDYLTENEVRLGDGIHYNVQEGDVVQDDMQSLIEGYGFVRPYSWFAVLSNKYEPKNCEQLALYILQFLLAKTLTAKRREEGKGKKNKWHKWWKIANTAFFTKTGPLLTGSFALAAGIIYYFYLKKRMGDINMEKLQQALSAISSKGLWRQNLGGIKILNKGLLEY